MSPGGSPAGPLPPDRGHTAPATPAQAAERLTAEPARTALCCDFDGTLAPIVTDPTRSALPADSRAALEALATRLGVVAIVSGRPVRFLLERAAISGVRLLGLYGLEEADADGRIRVAEGVAGWESAVEEAKARLTAELEGRAGLYLEDKGLAVAVHWRHAPDHREAELLVSVTVEGIAEATGLSVEPGKLVAELRPPVERDKGTALAEVAEGFDIVAYLGDDLGDLPALAAARARGGIAIGVDHGAGETPAELRAATDVLLDGPEAVAAFLVDLAARTEA